MNINTRQLRACIQVAELGSFTKAAEEMHVTQAGISGLIRELEGQLGFRLFERTTRRVTLTEPGKKFLAVAQETESRLRLSIKELSDELSGSRRALRVAASPVVVNGFLPSVLKEHRQRHPTDVIEFLDVARASLAEEVERGSADLGLGVFIRPMSGIRLNRLFYSSLVLISPRGWKPDTARTEGGLLPPERVPVEHLIRLDAENPLQQWVDQWVTESAHPARTHDPLRFRQIESCVAMVEAGQGHFIAPDFAIPACLRYRVSIRALACENARLSFHAISRAGASERAVARDFLNSFVSFVAHQGIGREHQRFQAPPEQRTTVPVR